MRFEFGIPVACPCSCNVKIHSECFMMKNTSFLQRHRRNLKVDEPSFQLNALETSNRLLKKSLDGKV